MPAARHGFRYFPDLHFNDPAIRQHLFVVKRQARLHMAYNAICLDMAQNAIITDGERTASSPRKSRLARIDAAHCPKCERNSLREALGVFVLNGGRYWDRTSGPCRVKRK